LTYTSKDVRYSDRGGTDTALAVDASDIQKNLYAADMIALRIRIIGDPTLLKQDDVFFGQNLDITPGPLTRNQSIITDNGELYVNVEFATPEDYNEETGLAVPGRGKYSTSTFSGEYKLINVESTIPSRTI